MDPLFQVHRLNEDGLLKAHKLAEAFNVLLEIVRHHSGESREFSIVKTKLEEACFFAKKAMANLPENQVEQKASSAD